MFYPWTTGESRAMFWVVGEKRLFPRKEFPVAFCCPKELVAMKLLLWLAPPRERNFLFESPIYPKLKLG